MGPPITMTAWYPRTSSGGRAPVYSATVSSCQPRASRYGASVPGPSMATCCRTSARMGSLLHGYCVPHLAPPYWRGNSPCAVAVQHLAQVTAVELGGVLSDDLTLLYLADVLEVTLYNVTRMRPGRGSMGVVGRPHDVVHPNPVPASDSEGVIDKGAVHLAPEVFAGLQGQLRWPGGRRTG